MGEIFTNCTFEQIYKEKHLISRKHILRKWARNFGRHATKEDIEKS